MEVALMPDSSLERARAAAASGSTGQEFCRVAQLQIR